MAESTDTKHLRAVAEEARDIANRLRGRYARGPIQANGEPEFGWRNFTVMPVTLKAGSPFPAIYEEAAATITDLLDRMQALEEQNRKLSTDVLDVAISDRLDEAGSPLSWRERAEAAEARALALEGALRKAGKTLEQVDGSLQAMADEGIIANVSWKFVTREIRDVRAALLPQQKEAEAGLSAITKEPTHD